MPRALCTNPAFASQGGAFGNSFMDRLEGDARRREVNRVESEKRCVGELAVSFCTCVIA